MAAVRVGSIAAFNVLYERYCDRVYRVARSVCGDDGRAQDAVQEAFISIWRTRANYDDRRTVAAWVLTVARTRAIDVAGRNEPHLVRRADMRASRMCRPPAPSPGRSRQTIKPATCWVRSPSFPTLSEKSSRSRATGDSRTRRSLRISTFGSAPSRDACGWHWIGCDETSHRSAADAATSDAALRLSARGTGNGANLHRTHTP
jgi:RNA polymerase sigma factor (sigma-70 family)